MVDESPSANEAATREAREQFVAMLQARRSAARATSATTIRHNEMNRTRYEERLHNEIAGNAPLIEQKTADRDATITRHKEEWADLIGERWHDACLANISDPNATAILSDRISRHKSGRGLNQISMLITGYLGRGKTYLGYAYAYELISAGLLKPSEVFIGTEQELAKITRGGFRSAEMLEDLISPQYRFYMIDDVGRATFPDDLRRREIWHALVDNIYSTRKTLVITTNLPIHDKPGVLASWVGDSTESRIRHITGNGVVIMNGDNKREEIAARLEADWQRNRV